MICFAPARPGDEITLARLRQQCWAATYRGIYPDAMIDHFDFPWHEKQDLARISSPNFDVSIIQENGTAIGYMVMRHGAPPLLYSLYLLPAYQHRGIGKLAFQRMKKYCQAQNHPCFLCHCQPENTAALAFYQHMGGTIIARDESNAEAYMNSVTLRFDIHKKESMRHIVTLTDMDILGTPGLSTAKPRLTARAVVINPAGQLAVMYAAKFGIHTLPGGGVEEGESIEEALYREITEETGCTIASIEPLGIIEENRAHADYTQINHYFIVHTADDALHPHLTALETENGTSASWYAPDEAYKRIASPVFERPQGKFLQARDVKALTAYRQLTDRKEST